MTTLAFRSALPFVIAFLANYTTIENDLSTRKFL